MAQSYADDVRTYFTDVDALRDLFRAYLAAAELPKRILVIHGVGGIGKSTLLRMFRLHCKGVATPVALASGDEVKSAPAILGDWADDLKADGVILPTFAKTRQHYRTIQAKAEDKAQESRKKLGDLAGKTAGKVAETAAGAAVGAAIGSAIPVIGPIAGALGGMGAEALVDWLRGQGFAKADIDLLLDPTRKLTDDFLVDIERVAPKRRLVLMLDTFEQLSTLEDWARDLAQRLHPNALLVVSGRAMPNWSRAWPGWLAQARVEELKPMTDDVMRELVRRYYATMRGGEPDPKQVEAIITFARGLPMVVTSAVQLWVERGVEDFEVVKPKVVADLVDRLKEGVPEAMTPVLEAAATVRWFNKDILRAVTGQADVNQAYDELRRFPFVRSRLEGLALHDAVREIMDEYLHVHDPKRHRELHEYAARYFEALMTERASEEAERLGLERLYHRVCADEEAGVNLLEQMAETLVRYQLVHGLRVMLADVGTYEFQLQHTRSQQWLRYYRARLAHLEMRLNEAERTYQEIGESEQVEPRLRAYALGDWGTILEKGFYLAARGEKKALQTVIDGLALMPLSDAKRAALLLTISGIYMRLGQVDLAIQYASEALAWLYERNSHNYYAILGALTRLKDIALRSGNWKEGLDFHSKGLQLLDGIESDYPKAGFIGTWAVAWSWMGRYSESERNARYTFKVFEKVDAPEATLCPLRDMAFALGVQGRYAEAAAVFQESLEVARRVDRARQLAAPVSEWWGLWYRAIMLSKQGHSLLAANDLRLSLAISRKIIDRAYALAPHLALGVVYETTCKWKFAEQHYNYAFDSHLGHEYFRCMGLTGLIRVKHVQGDFSALPSLMTQAEQLAQHYEYNDHLTSLRLTQGHVAWDGHLPEWGSGFDATLYYYQHALIHALRYNRFLLDEALSGRPQGTPLRPIIPHCLERGEEGRRMLIALRDWWQMRANDIGAPRPDTISPIPEGIPLLEAERIAREREPGDGSPQKTVTEQIDAALSK